jgi:O-antigen/teichoic acid export membrane protein
MSIMTKIRAMMSGPSTLRRRAAKASIWSIAGIGMNSALRLASNLLMTHLLVPQAFGLMAMVTTLHIGLTMFTDIGIQQSVVRAQNGNDPTYLRVAWIVQAARGLMIAALVILAAGLLWILAPGLAPKGTVYAEPVLPGLIAVSSLVMIFKGLESTTQWLAARNMDVGRLTLVNLSNQLIALVAMAGFAQINASVWALLAGMLVGAGSRTVLSNMVFPGPRMGFEWNREISDELWGYGKWIMGASILGFVANQADRLILGALLGTETFGYYVIATVWVQAFNMVIQKLTTQVGFSAFSEVLRDRPGRIGVVFRRFSNGIDAICITGFLLCLAGGPWLIHLLYKPSYATAATFMPLLALSILPRRFNCLGALVLSSGNSMATMQIAASRAIAICVGLPLGFHLFGMTGALLAVALSQVAGVPLVIRKAAPILRGEVTREILWVGAIFAVAVILFFFYGGL